MLQITKLSDRRKYSLLLPAATVTAFFSETLITSSLSNSGTIAGISRGMACIEDPASLGTALRADGTAPIRGFITRHGQVALTLADVTMPNRSIGPFIAADPASFEYAEEYMAGNYAAGGATDGYDHVVVSGPGAIASNTALGTPLSFSGGKTCKAVSGQYAEFALASVVETPLDAPSGAFCIRAHRIPGYKLA